MPNAPSPGSVNFGTIVAPDVAAEQMALARRQQIVDLLRKQATDPMEQQVVTGAGPSRVVPISPFQGLAKMASAYLAGKSQDAIDSKTLDLNKQMADRYSQILGGGAPASVAAPVAMAQGASQGSVGPTVANAARMNTMTTQPQTQGGNNFDMARLLRGSLVEQLGGAPAASAYWDEVKLPESVKTNNYYGLNKSEVADALRRKNAAEGQQVVSKDATVLGTNPDGSVTPKFTAPSVDMGANIEWVNGAPVAKPIAGLADIKASTAGAVTAATEQEKAAREMVTVNTPQGPKMMTRAQAVQLAGAPAAGGAPIAPPVAPQPGIPQPAMPRPTAGNPPPGSGVVPPESPQDRMGVLQAQLVKTQQAIANPSVNDADRQRLKDDARDIQSEMSRMGTSNGKPNGLTSKAGPGITLQDEGTAEANKTAGKQGVDTIFTQYGVLRTAPDMMNTLERAKALVPQSFAGSQAENKLAIAKFFNNNLGTNIAADKVANTEELRSSLFRQVMDNLKKMDSQPSESQQKMLQQAMGTIGTDPAAIPRVIQITQDILSLRVNQHNETVKQAMKSGVQFPFEPTVTMPAFSPKAATGFRIVGVQ